jgi:hypothetical protein
MNSNEQKPLKSWLLSPEDLHKLAIPRAWWSRAPPRPSRAVLYVEHVARGTDLFRLICERDMEGVVAKQASASYTPEATTWVKIKNREYSQAVGREDFFDRRRAAAK